MKLKFLLCWQVFKYADFTPWIGVRTLPKVMPSVWLKIVSDGKAPDLGKVVYPFIAHYSQVHSEPEW